MKIDKVSEAKARISQILDLAASGEEVIIARAGRPMAKLIPYHVSQQARTPGCWKSKVKISKDFDELPEDFSRAFQGEEGRLFYLNTYALRWRFKAYRSLTLQAAAILDEKI